MWLESVLRSAVLGCDFSLKSLFCLNHPKAEFLPLLFFHVRNSWLLYFPLSPVRTHLQDERDPVPLSFPLSLHKSMRCFIKKKECFCVILPLATNSVSLDCCVMETREEGGGVEEGGGRKGEWATMDSGGHHLLRMGGCALHIQKKKGLKDFNLAKDRGTV